MAKANATVAATPARTPPVIKKENSTGSSSTQRSILGFFAKKTVTGTQQTNGPLKPKTNVNGAAKPEFKKGSTAKSITPAPSSDAPEPASDSEAFVGEVQGLPSPLSPAKTDGQQAARSSAPVVLSSPSRKARIE